ncbi:MAG: hypothetical protein HOW73_36070 [Polyangiaceae bacterium]|nr:hypothetical protein [Polyangiaceae bacterium]
MNRRWSLLLGLCFAFACSDLKTYALSGQAYDEANDCLEEDLVIDVIEGEASGTCEGVRCIRSLETGTYYVTSHCEVPTAYEDLTDQDEGPCALALAAYELGEEAQCE